MDHHLQYPKLQTIAFSNRLLNLSHEARTCSDKDNISFDLSRTEFICPFGIILLTGTIHECLVSGKTAKYRRPNKEATKKFLSGIGFNNFFKLSDGEYKHKIESPNVQLKQLDHVDYMLTDQILEVFGFSLQMSEGVQGSLKLALNELMTNAFDHSGSHRGCYVCAQSYQQAKLIRLCIADFGIGILRCLRQNPTYSNLANDEQAIQFAVQEGVTSRTTGSAGYGLTHIQRFIKINGGKMYILSGEGKIVWNYSNKKKKERQTMQTPFQGTIVYLEINADKEGFYFMQSADGDIF